MLNAAAIERHGGAFFSPANMLVWRTRIGSEIRIGPGGVHVFCTSERTGNGPRVYSIRGLDPTKPGTVTTYARGLKTAGAAWSTVTTELAAHGWKWAPPHRGYRFAVEVQPRADSPLLECGQHGAWLLGVERLPLPFGDRWTIGIDPGRLSLAPRVHFGNLDEGPARALLATLTAPPLPT